MTYQVLILPFLAAAAILTLLSALRPHFGKRMIASTIAAVILLALTAVFDNVMIGAGLVKYPEENVSGIAIGLAPIEDFAYTLCAAYGVPALFVLLSRKKTT
ncbi:lycopene cyclase domain-containing protein [Microbacterium endophyticum]|uniref:Lycopene cyclase domain-containing protein n=1 Tax=Microbacterium endophyticum TaxID=1526412 RepID=A0A7W4YKT7_9MICO|nr:lycopene cyclase domain-containing protein [Microbacterium endophyticum]MBB2974755.1 lycopene cyclase domain-containing protein [Microbacterium endophyticum]NIK37052.1 lycopene cyclase domain-containing protein [Microbacterium endophyticum]